MEKRSHPKMKCKERKRANREPKVSSSSTVSTLLPAPWLNVRDASISCDAKDQADLRIADEYKNDPRNPALKNQQSAAH